MRVRRRDEHRGQPTDYLTDALSLLQGWTRDGRELRRTLRLDDSQHAALAERIKVVADALQLRPEVRRLNGHTQIKVWNDGAIGFKTQIINPNHETFVAGHVHLAPVGVAGAIVVPLFGGPATTASHIKLSGSATPSPGTTGAALCQNPSAYYVNYHTTAFPAGAIRGQL